MHEPLITLQGWVGADVRVRPAGDTTVASFRVACTPRRYQKKTDDWADADTQWYTVNAWRGLGDHCERSLRRGDPVVVHGRLNAQTWTNSSNIEVTSFEVDAITVGHDLTRGTSAFTRSLPAAADATSPGPERSPEGSEPTHDEQAEAAPAA